MNNPLISIIVPVYNVEEYLEYCLNSLVNQTFREYEVILVDDGSTDDSPEICDAFADSHSEFSVVHKQNGGLSSARNAGIHAAKGEYLLFLDSDDFLISNNALEDIANVLISKTPDVLIGLPDEYNADASTVIIRHERGEWKEQTIYLSDSIINELYSKNGIWVTLAQTKIIRKDYCITNKLMFYDGIYHEDDEWIARVLLSSPQIAFLYKPWYGYRHRENSIVSSAESQKIYKRTCDKIIVAYSMLQNKSAKRYKCYIKYASDYLLNTIISAGRFSAEKESEFIEYLNPYRECYKTILYSKDVKLILKAVYIMLFGEKSFIDKYIRRLNAES